MTKKQTGNKVRNKKVIQIIYIQKGKTSKKRTTQK